VHNYINDRSLEPIREGAEYLMKPISKDGLKLIRIENFVNRKNKTY
jgi:hypothetical protein